MSAKFIKMFFLFVFFAFIVSGCTHYAPFPEAETHPDTLTPKPASVKKENKTDKTTVKVKEKTKEKTESVSPNPKKTAKNKDLSVKKTEQSVLRDLTKPNPEVDDIVPAGTSYNVIGKSTPAILTDIDLTEMDAEDGEVKIIKPDSETRTILATKKVQKILPSKIIKKEASAPSVFYLAETVYFNNGSAAVDSQYLGKLRKIVKEAKAHNGKIIVQGFASSRTRNTDMMSHKLANLKVSVKRADNVADILVKYGMPRSRIVTEGLSDSRPAYQEVMPEGERLNRRAEVYVRY